MSNKDLQEILSSPDKNITETTNPLARLFRLVLSHHNVGYDQFDRSITNYLNREQQAASRSKKEQSREKGNLVKELVGNSFTFKNFTKGLRVLNPVSAELTLTLKWKRNQETVHTIIMKIQDPNEDGDDQDDTVGDNKE